MSLARLLVTPSLSIDADTPVAKPAVTAAIATCASADPVSAKRVKPAGPRGTQRLLNPPRLPRKNCCRSGDGLRASGVFVLESEARAEAFYGAERRMATTRQHRVAPEIVHLHSPVMVDNAAGRIVVDED